MTLRDLALLHKEPRTERTREVSGVTPTGNTSPFDVHPLTSRVRSVRGSLGFL
jgi:hypothetical protein